MIVIIIISSYRIIISKAYASPPTPRFGVMQHNHYDGEGNDDEYDDDGDDDMMLLR